MAVRRVQSLALNTNITGLVYFALTRAPAVIREPLLARLASFLSPKAIERLIKTLKYLVIVGWINRIQKRLNDAALNAWTFRAQKDKWTWNWEIAVVTGGCSGIGKEITKGLTAKGVKVAVLDIQDLPADLERNSKVAYFRCDVTSPSSIADAAKAVRKELGSPSILVNNAGIGQPHAILDTSNEWVTKIFQINIISHWWLIKEFMPDMVKKNKGHIVGLASMASFVSPAGIVDYASTKAAVMALHEGLNQEIKHIYKAPGVLNTVVHPSWVRTALVNGYETHLEKTQGGLMKPEIIGAKIVNQITSCRGGQLIIPKKLAFASAMRGQPNWIQELLRDMSVGGKAAKFPGSSPWQGAGGKG